MVEISRLVSGKSSAQNLKKKEETVRIYLKQLDTI